MTQRAPAQSATISGVGAIVISPEPRLALPAANALQHTQLERPLLWPVFRCPSMAAFEVSTEEKSSVDLVDEARTAIVTVRGEAFLGVTCTAEQRGEYDYLTVYAKTTLREVPSSFGGISGGGKRVDAGAAFGLFAGGIAGGRLSYRRCQEKRDRALAAAPREETTSIPATVRRPVELSIGTGGVASIPT